MRSRKKTQLNTFFSQKPSQLNKIVLKQVEENAKTKL